MEEDKKLLSRPVELPGEKTHFHAPSFSRRRSFGRAPKKLLIILACLALIAAFGYGGFKFYETRKNKSADQASQQPAITSPAPLESSIPSGSDVPEAELTESYTGQDVSVELTYPKTWKVVEAEGGLRIESPEFSYPVGGGQKDGYFRIYIRTGAREADGKHIGRGIAIKPSEKLTYSAPAVGQREQTLISTFGIDGLDNFGFFLLAGNFQLKAGDSLGPAYGREPETYIIAGGYSDKTLKDDLATNPVKVDYYSTTRAYKQAVEIIKTLKLK